ncbi:flotillin-like protein 3 [Daucus carota subsp. sativus]|uniref:Flotillin-like n=1 Tax=Daucus carota subsp. sativus TaxID=79200 RepID=A0A166GYX2_DAUCS|nr:PREDICTED: flotillin-like protein 3 [Daucus carota subsp. sativus]
MYKVAGPSEYLAITGLFINDVKLAKKKYVLPFQKCVKFDISPVNYEFNVQAMSAEKLPFVLPAVFTIGPRLDDHDSLMLYAKLVSSHDKHSNHVKDLVMGVIEGETRVLAAGMTMDEIFRGTKKFKQQVFDQVQLELDQFGLRIFNANVKQLVDVPGHEYFSYLGQKTQMEAANQAKVDVSEAKMKGAIGAKEREGLTLQNAAKVDAESKIMATRRQGEGNKEEIRIKTEVQIYQNQRNAEVEQANAELAKKKAMWSQSAKMAEVEAQMAVSMRAATLQMEVEKQNALTMTEKLRAQDLSKANIDYDIQVQETNAKLYAKQKAAEAVLFEAQKKAEAQKASADADMYARQRAAEAELYSKLKEAEGTTALAQAQAINIGNLLNQVGGNYSSLRDYLMINNGTYKDLARLNADAVRGLQPKINIWTGAPGNAVGEGSQNGGGSGGALKEIAGLYGMLPPLLQTVNDQTGMLPPPWLASLPTDTSEK